MQETALGDCIRTFVRIHAVPNHTCVCFWRRTVVVLIPTELVWEAACSVRDSAELHSLADLVRDLHGASTTSEVRSRIHWPTEASKHNILAHQ